MNIFFLFVLFLLAVEILLLWLIHQESCKTTKKKDLWALEQQVRDAARCKTIEEGLQEWLKTLELPELAEKKKLEAAARQLRIVLVERLMRGPRVRELRV